MDFPSLDFSHFNGSVEQKSELCGSLANSLRSFGFVKLRNHGLSEEYIKNLFDFAQQFFHLPLETKLSAPHPPEANPNRGYCFVGQEDISQITGFEKGLEASQKFRDEKETFDFGGPNDATWKNVWVDDQLQPGFRQCMEDHFNACYEIQLKILRAIAIGLGLPETYFELQHSRAENEARIIHYPEISLQSLLSGRTTRVAEHTDFGTITLLFQDSTGGLEVEDQGKWGTFHSIESSSPSEMILNVGDSLQRWTNNTLRSATHRVTVPHQMKQNVHGDEIIPARYSVAYFSKPNRDESLLPLADFVSETQPAKYEDITAWDYNQSKLKKVFS